MSDAMDEAQQEAQASILVDIISRAVNNMSDNNALMLKEDLEICENFDAILDITEDFKDKYEDAFDKAIHDITKLTGNHVNHKLPKKTVADVNRAIQLAEELEGSLD